MAAVNALKKQIESGQGGADSAPPPANLLEVFCVDCSISMARSLTFPYIIGESKLTSCKRIIMEGFSLPDNCTLHTALVKFNNAPHMAVPFAVHSQAQDELIKQALTDVEHQKGSAIYSSYAFCEKIVSDYQKEHALQDCKILIHLFTDGVDHGSLPEDIERYQKDVQPNSEGLRQSFLYSFDTSFEQSSQLAKTLQANLVVIQDTDITAALEDRDRWVLKFLNKRKVSKAQAGFNLTKGYTPDLASVYTVLQKVYRFFAAGNASHKEGLFRVNANVNQSKQLASQLLTGNEVLSDFEDSILVAHALKTALSHSPPILPPAFQASLIEVAKHKGVDRQLALVKSKVDDLPNLNKECFHILLFLLQTIAKEADVNKMTSTNLAVIFTYLLFPELLVPNPGLQELIVSMIDHCQTVFPVQPTLKTTSGLADKEANANALKASISHAPSDDPKPTQLTPRKAATPQPQDIRQSAPPGPRRASTSGTGGDHNKSFSDASAPAPQPHAPIPRLDSAPIERVLPPHHHRTDSGPQASPRVASPRDSLAAPLALSVPSPRASAPPQSSALHQPVHAESTPVGGLPKHNNLDRPQPHFVRKHSVGEAPPLPSAPPPSSASSSTTASTSSSSSSTQHTPIADSVATHSRSSSFERPVPPHMRKKSDEIPVHVLPSTPSSGTGQQPSSSNPSISPSNSASNFAAPTSVGVSPRGRQSTSPR